MRKFLWLALLAPLVADAYAAGEGAPVCYTQRTRPENFVLPKQRAAETMALPELHLPDASKRNEPVIVVLDLHVTATGAVGRADLQQGSRVETWNQGVLATAKEWSFVPGTIDGEPSPMCIRFRITATLQGAN